MKTLVKPPWVAIENLPKDFDYSKVYCVKDKFNNIRRMTGTTFSLWEVVAVLPLPLPWLPTTKEWEEECLRVLY